MLYILGTIVGVIIVIGRFIFSTENGTFADGMKDTKSWVDSFNVETQTKE